MDVESRGLGICVFCFTEWWQICPQEMSLKTCQHVYLHCISLYVCMYDLAKWMNISIYKYLDFYIITDQFPHL